MLASALLRLRLALLNGQEELELWRELLLAVEAVREVDAAQPARREMRGALGMPSAPFGFGKNFLSMEHGVWRMAYGVWSI